METQNDKKMIRSLEEMVKKYKLVAAAARFNKDGDIAVKELSMLLPLWGFTVGPERKYDKKNQIEQFGEVLPWFEIKLNEVTIMHLEAYRLNKIVPGIISTPDTRDERYTKIYDEIDKVWSPFVNNTAHPSKKQ